MANDYTTSTDAFAEMPEGNYSSSDYPNMASFVTAASRLIDLEVGRWEGFFAPTTDSVTNYYDGLGDDEQEIDEYASIASVSVSESGSLSSSDYTLWVQDTDYLTKPYNAANHGKPINKLALVGYNGTKGTWYSGQRTIQVVGIPGYSLTTPDVIELACRIQSVRWFMRAKGGYQDETGSDETGRMFYKGQLKLDGDVKALLHPFKLELDR